MDWWSIGFGFTGIITGLVGIRVAQVANKQSEKSNSLAQRALRKATKANNIAIKANKLAEDANTVSERALRISGENFDYLWGFRIEDDGSVCITHEGSHDALDLTLLVQAHHSSKAISPEAGHYRECDRASFGTQFLFDLKSIYPELVSKACAQKKKVTAYVGDSPSYSGKKPITFEVVAVLKWRTPGGRKCGGTFKHTLSCRENQSGAIEFKVVS